MAWPAPCRSRSGDGRPYPSAGNTRESGPEGRPRQVGLPVEAPQPRRRCVDPRKGIGGRRGDRRRLTCERALRQQGAAESHQQREDASLDEGDQPEDRDDHRPRLGRRHPLRGGTLQRGVRFHDVDDALSLQERRVGHDAGDLPPSAWSLREPHQLRHCRRDRIGSARSGQPPGILHRRRALEPALPGLHGWEAAGGRKPAAHPGRLVGRRGGPPLHAPLPARDRAPLLRALRRCALR